MKIRSLLFLLLLPGFALSQTKQITLEEIWQQYAFTPKGIPGFAFQKDGQHFTRLEADRILQFDLLSGAQTAVLFDAAKVTDTASGWEGSFDSYSFSADERKLLLAANMRPIYRWSRQGDYFIYDFSNGKLTRLYTDAPQLHATFSPDGSKVAFVAANDLYYKNLLTGETVRVTTDGRKNAVINGSSDWVYEEEFELVRAFEWSPDGQTLAFFRFDESAVPEFSMDMYKGGAYPEEVSFKYPKVGERNATVTAWRYSLASRQLQEIKTGAAADDYLPRLKWTPAGKLCITRMNRRQNHLQLLLAEPTGSSVTLLMEEKNERYLDLQEPEFLSDGSGFLWLSEKSGFRHVYRYDMQGKEQLQLTQGSWEVTNVYGLDEKNGLLYYQAAKDPLRRELYSVNLKGKKTRKISEGQGVHNAQFSPTFDYYINSFSTLNTPPVYVVRDRNGKPVRTLEENKAVADKQKEYGLRPAEFFTFKTEDGVDLNGFIIKPASAEGDAPGKHPVLMFAYGGPGDQQVLDQWKGNNYWWFQMLVQQGFVVACVDNRGTGGRGEAFKKQTYLQLGKLETQDQISAARFLGTRNFVDPARIGIFGWSFGGYLSSLCLLKGNEVFNSAIAVAPVTNWKWYDSIYTERYMQTYEDNKQGYDDNSPVNFANRLQGNYLLIHGLADDNVHFQNTAEMANQLISANKQFDTMIYPNLNHGLGSARFHVYSRMTKFLTEHLKGNPTP